MPTQKEIEAGRVAVRKLRDQVGVQAMDSELTEVVLLAAERVRAEMAAPCGVCGQPITESLKKL